jgi:hypothetical protein
MNLDEVVGEVIDRHGRHVIFDLPAESGGQARVAAHCRAHGPVLVLYKRRGDVFRVWTAIDDGRDCADALRGAVAPLRRLLIIRVPVKFNQHGVVDLRTERGFNRVQIRPMSVARHLHAVAAPFNADTEILGKTIRLQHTGRAYSGWRYVIVGVTAPTFLGIADPWNPTDFSRWFWQ